MESSYWNAWSDWGPKFIFDIHESDDARAVSWVGDIISGSHWYDKVGVVYKFRAWERDRVRYSYDHKRMQIQREVWVEAKQYILIGMFGHGIWIPQAPWHRFGLGPFIHTWYSGPNTL